LLGITFKPNTDIVAVVFQVTFKIISTFFLPDLITEPLVLVGWK
jgi:hypothetical protein